MSKSPRFCRTIIAFTAVLLSLFASTTARADFFPSPWVDVPFVTSGADVVKGMLKLAKVDKNDIVYDLGCGDGRIVIAAAKIHGAKGVGIDLDPDLISQAIENAKSVGVADRVKFITGDLFKQNFSDATVVMIYLFPQINRKLRPQLWEQLKVGTRVISHEFDMGPEWPPEKTERVGSKNIHFWTIREEHKKVR